MYVSIFLFCRRNYYHHTWNMHDTNRYSISQFCLKSEREKMFPNRILMMILVFFFVFIFRFILQSRLKVVLFFFHFCFCKSIIDYIDFEYVFSFFSFIVFFIFCEYTSTNKKKYEDISRIYLQRHKNMEIVSHCFINPIQQC